MDLKQQINEIQTSMAKVQKISKNITSFSGIYFVNDEFSCSLLRRLIDNQLGMRVSTKGYSYGNLIKPFKKIFF